MSESKLIEKALTQLLGSDLSKIKEIKIRWEDEVIVSIQWSTEEGRAKSSAKILKLDGGGFRILNSTL